MGLPQFLVGEFAGVQAYVVGDDLALAIQFPFIDHQSIQAHRASGVDFVRADADFGT